MGRRKSGSIAHGATSGRSAKRGTEKQRRWRQWCGLRRSRRVSGGLRPRGGKKRYTWLDIARRREGGMRLGKLISHMEV